MIARAVVGIEQIGEFDTLVDARSPAEYIDDHLPGAHNCPVLDDAQRAEVGTLYKQVSPFAARKRGAALVARNIADHIDICFADKPREWRPLVYCWRGGQRSGAFTHILREVGWAAHRLEGGYKAWRRHVIAQLGLLPARQRFLVISGATGSAKSRILEALAKTGEQVLHLERLAAHKGSVLGSIPGQEQPSQRAFESALYVALGGFDPARPVFVEAESRKIGVLHVPDELIGAIRAAPCLRIAATLPARVEFLLRDYHYALADGNWLRERLVHLRNMHSGETMARWNALIDAGAFPALVEELLVAHYDPLYQRSQHSNFTALAHGEVISCDDLGDARIAEIARRLGALAKALPAVGH